MREESPSQSYWQDRPSAALRGNVGNGRERSEEEWLEMAIYSPPARPPGSQHMGAQGKQGRAVQGRAAGLPLLNGISDIGCVLVDLLCVEKVAVGNRQHSDKGITILLIILVLASPLKCFGYEGGNFGRSTLCLQAERLKALCFQWRLLMKIQEGKWVWRNLNFMLWVKDMKPKIIINERSSLKALLEVIHQWGKQIHLKSIL